MAANWVDQRGLPLPKDDLESSMTATATTVNSAFDVFMRDVVNLRPDDVAAARASRRWLLEQVALFPERDDKFPILWREMNCALGSFARCTKKRPLDDIDQLVCLHAQGGTYLDVGGDVVITIAGGEENRLRHYLHDGTQQLNSTRILNAFKRAAEDVPNYSKADIVRDGEVVRIGLASYPWDFEVAPAFHTTPEADGRDFYLIPNGTGNWKKTDPRVMAALVKSENKRHAGHMLDQMRLAKYWNARHTAPALDSYLFEVMVLDYCRQLASPLSQFVDLALPDLFAYIGKAVWSPVWDPAGIQGNLNTVDTVTCLKVAERANLDAQRAAEARRLENDGDGEASIDKWGEVFGPEFPSYE